MIRHAFAAVLMLCLAAGPGAGRLLAEETSYQKPPKAVLEVLHAPLPPDASLNPTHDAMILAAPVSFPPISHIALPALGLAGVRVVPRNRTVHGPYGSGQDYWSAFTLVSLPGGARTSVALPAGAKVGLPVWSADGRRYAFTNITAEAIELWLGAVGSDSVRKVEGVRLNPMLGDSLQWMPDQKTLIVKTVPEGQGPAPTEPSAPKGPHIQESMGGKGASSTYEVRDVLKNVHDEELFDYYAASQLMLVDAGTGSLKPLGQPALYEQIDPSPDGRYILVGKVQRPYSYLTTHDHFPTAIELWDSEGRLAHKLATLPLADAVPIWGVRTGPREFRWRATEPATLLWAEAQDGGDWKIQVPHRDRLMTLKAPFKGAPAEALRTEMRFDGITWGEKGGLAFVTEIDLIKHWTKTLAVDFDDLKSPARVVWDMSSDESYKFPGYPVLRALPNGFHVMEQDGDSVFLSGTGASVDGDRPFLDRLDLKTLKTERLFRCEKTAYERFVAWSDVRARRFITRRETPKDFPNYVLRVPDKQIPAAEDEAVWTSSAKPITLMADPTPELRLIAKRLVSYKRKDGIDLSFTLYLPPHYKEGTRLPAVLYAYPLDYTDPKMAGQVKGSTQRFTTFGYRDHLYFLLQGYAVIDNPLMPVVGDANKIYDTYMEQLVAGAQAAVDKAVSLGVVDRDRIGVMGHSHGGLMTANLVAHTELFRAGIARSGAYNRTLKTAFGFQNERRTLWEAPEVYTKVSPFFHANEMKAPLLLIHGEDDANPGTVSLQSEQFFEAIRGNGGVVRLVMLPSESHWYQSIESNEHVLHEMLSWFDRWVKNAPPKAAKL
ncbi:MAG: S9 family peptidase [Elusimicrobia bacterium]|nr:S9 family peptidase [Elusimicrobiota bacterium]